MKRRLPVRGARTYTGYSIGCAIAWAAVLLGARQRADRTTFQRITLFCLGWWSGWLSATIARAIYPRKEK
jgi:hypothetical protein